MAGSYRSVIEVLKFQSPIDVLKNSATVTSQWHQISDSNELWFSFFPVPLDSNISIESAKSYYAKMYKDSVFVVMNTKLLRFFVTSHIWSEIPLRHPVNIDILASITRVSSNALFCCGAPSPSANTFLVRTDTGEVQKLQYLTPHRHGMGVIFYQGIVYTFGGFNGNVQIANCSKFMVTGTGWVQLPILTVRRAMFNRCSTYI